jgi:hypothetical protein
MTLGELDERDRGKQSRPDAGLTASYSNHASLQTSIWVSQACGFRNLAATMSRSALSRFKRDAAVVLSGRAISSYTPDHLRQLDAWCHA